MASPTDPEGYRFLIHALLHTPPWSLGTAPPASVAHVAGPTNPAIPLSPPAASSQEPEGMDDATSIVEDKRRRNTAASARFRVKKKLKTLGLERAVADLVERTEELDGEASDLRRENAWLKEIVLLKGRSHILSVGSQATSADRRGHDGGGRAQPEPS